jgi:hypothetical protein
MNPGNDGPPLRPPVETLRPFIETLSVPNEPVGVPIEPLGAPDEAARRAGVSKFLSYDMRDTIDESKHPLEE